MLVKTQLLPQSELALQSALAAYENGKVEFATLLEAQRQIRKAQQEHPQVAGRRADAPGRHRTHRWEKTCEDLHDRDRDRPARGRRCRQLLAGHARTAAVSEAAVAGAASAQVAAPKQRKLLYYRNPMGLADTSPTPKKDPMGMDYIAGLRRRGRVDAGGRTASPNQVRISTEKVQKLGVRTEAAALRPLGKTVRAAGRIEPDERRVFAVAPKFEGYVERLHVNATGQPVAKGQPLFEVYSPELVSAQREYVIAMQGSRR